MDPRGASPSADGRISVTDTLASELDGVGLSIERASREVGFQPLQSQAHAGASAPCSPSHASHRFRPRSAQSYFRSESPLRSRSPGYINFQALDSEDENPVGSGTDTARVALFRRRALSPRMVTVSPCSRELFGVLEEPASEGHPGGTTSGRLQRTRGDADLELDEAPVGKFRALTPRKSSPVPIKSGARHPCKPATMANPRPAPIHRPRLFSAPVQPETPGFPRRQSDSQLNLDSASESRVLLPCASDPTIRGDGQKCTLPTIRDNASHADLPCISPDTVCQLLDGEYDDALAGFHVIDCRYPFEYAGGHVKGAHNLWTIPDWESFCFGGKHIPLHAKPKRRTALIFHCEFSSHRGPAALKHIRNVDRRIHLSTYPELFYPELYLLDGGYRRFFLERPMRCDPAAYTLMLDPAFEKEHLEAQRTVRRTREQHRVEDKCLIAQLTIHVEQAAKQKAHAPS